MAAPLRTPSPYNAGGYCPVTTDEVVEERYRVEYEGRTVYFCCDKCRRKFIAEPSRYAANLASSTTATATEHHPHPAPAGEARLTRLGRLHPLAVHFPVALILSAGLAELPGAFRRKPAWHEFSRFSITLGALGALIAVPLGWLAAGAPGSDALTEWHRWLGTATGLTSAAAALLARTHHLTAYRATLAVGVALVAAAGHLGGVLTHGEDFVQIWK